MTLDGSKRKLIATWWAVQSPTSGIFKATIRATMRESWEHGFSMVSFEQGREWHGKYWKRWDASIRSAKKLGYKFIRVRITT